MKACTSPNVPSALEIEIPNWKKFNGRSDCAATWLRLENRLFESDEMYRLTGAEITVWIYILCQASKKASGRFQLDFEMAVGRIKVEQDVIDSALKKLTDSGAIIAHGRLRTSADVNVRSCAGYERTNDTNVTIRTKGEIDPAPASPAPLVIARYCERWEGRYGSRPPIDKKTAGQFKRFAEEHGLERSLRFVDAFLSMPDPWFVTKRHDFATMNANLGAVSQFADTGKMLTPAHLQKLNEQLDEAMGPKPPSIADIIREREERDRRFLESNGV